MHNSEKIPIQKLYYSENAQKYSIWFKFSESANKVLFWNY